MTTVKQHTRTPRKTKAEWTMQARLEQERMHGFRIQPANQNEACPETYDELAMLSLGNPVVGER